MNPLVRLEMLKDLAEQTVDRGVSRVEQVHQLIADLPFAVADGVGLGRLDVLGVRARQRRTIAVVYGAIRDVNRAVGALLSDAFETAEDGRDVARVLDDRPAVGIRHPG